MAYVSRAKSSERFVHPALIDEAEETLLTPVIPKKAQPTHEVPDFILPGFLFLGRMYADSVAVLQHLGLTGATVENVESTLDDLQSRLVSLDEQWSDRRARIRREWRAAENDAKKALRNRMLEENIPDEPSEDTHTPHQNRFGGIMKFHPYGRGLMPLTIYMTFRQLVMFIEVMEATYNLDEDWKRNLRIVFNDAVPFYAMMDKCVAMLRNVQNNALNKSDFLRAFPSQDAGVVEEALKRLLEFGVIEVMAVGGPGSGTRGRPGYIYYLNW